MSYIKNIAAALVVLPLIACVTEDPDTQSLSRATPVGEVFDELAPDIAPLPHSIGVMTPDIEIEVGAHYANGELALTNDTTGGFEIAAVPGKVVRLTLADPAPDAEIFGVWTEHATGTSGELVDGDGASYIDVLMPCDGGRITIDVAAFALDAETEVTFVLRAE